MRRIRVQYSPMGQRWSIDVVGWETNVEEVSEQGDVTISRDQRGRVVSIVVDASRLESDVARIISENFGREIADLMTESNEDEVDELFVTGDRAGSSVVRSQPDGASTAVVVLSNEPGVPSPIDDGRFRFVVEADSRNVVGLLDHDRSAARIRIEIGLRGNGTTLWVRVAEGESGAILALAPLRETGEESSSADLAFGLDVSMQALHVSVSEEPMSDPGDRVDRRRSWARSLEGAASRRARWLRSDAPFLYERAATVYENLGDGESATRCRAVARRVRRRRISFGGLGFFVLAIALAGIGFIVGRDGSSGSLPVVETVPLVEVSEPPSVIVAEPPPVTVAEPPPTPGPVDLVFDDDQEAQVFVTGDAVLSPGEEVRFVVRAQAVEEVNFNRLQDCVGAESGLAGKNVSGDGPMYQPTFIPVLENRSDPSVGSRAFSPFAVTRAIETYFVISGACLDNWSQDGVPFTASARARYVQHEVSIELPEDLEPGIWALRLFLENVEGISADGTLPTIRVVN
jgi:hypothetical protein